MDTSSNLKIFEAISLRILFENELKMLSPKALFEQEILNLSN
jgi:hypothetical protein